MSNFLIFNKLSEQERNLVAEKINQFLELVNISQYEIDKCFDSISMSTPEKEEKEIQFWFRGLIRAIASST